MKGSWFFYGMLDKFIHYKWIAFFRRLTIFFRTVTDEEKVGIWGFSLIELVVVMGIMGGPDLEVGAPWALLVCEVIAGLFLACFGGCSQIVSQCGRRIMQQPAWVAKGGWSERSEADH